MCDVMIFDIVMVLLVLFEVHKIGYLCHNIRHHNNELRIVTSSRALQ